MAQNRSVRLPADEEDGSNERTPLVASQGNHEPAGESSRSSSRRFGSIFEPLAHPKDLRPLEKLLLILALFLVLLAAIFIGLFAGVKSRLDHSPPTVTPPGSPPPPSHPGEGSPWKTTCDTETCVLASAEILKGLDTKLDPCDDFYEFTTAGWRKNHPIPSDAGLFGIGQWLASENTKIMVEVLDGSPASSSSSSSASSHANYSMSAADSDDHVDKQNLAKLRDFYDACMDTEAQDKAGDEPLLTLIDELQSRLHVRDPSEKKDAVADELAEEETPTLLFVAQKHEKGRFSPSPVPPNRPPPKAPLNHPPKEDPTPYPPQGKRQKALTQAISWAHSRGLGVFFGARVDGDIGEDPQLGTPLIDPGGLGFPDKVYYEDKDEIEFYNSVVTQAFENLVKAVHARDLKKSDATELKKKKGSNDKKLEEALKHARTVALEVVKFETELAEAQPDGIELSDPMSTYNPVTLAQFSYLLTSVDVAAYFSALSVRTPTSIIVANVPYLRRVNSLLSRTRDEVLEGYIVWTLLRTYGRGLGPSATLRQPFNRLDKRIKGIDDDAKENRVGTCLDEINEALGYSAGRYFVERTFSVRAKERAEEIIEALRTSFLNRLPELAWLDPVTRQKAEVKARAVKVKVGYPVSPNTTDPRNIWNYYADLKVQGPGHFFENIVNSAIRLTKRPWNNVGRKLDAQRWDMFPSEVNAYYSPPENEIVFPAGILQPLYFHVDWPGYLQFGAFGTTAGHELSHAFDPAGREYDENGYLRDWWTNDTAVEFNRRRDCLIAQYGQYTMPLDGKKTIKLNPKLTIGEDVADGGGLSQSYYAWKSTLKDSKGIGLMKLPGLEYTPEQLFFIAYGLAWARNIRPQETIRRIRTDPHSPTKWRVNGALQNSPEFAAAFNCKVGVDRMTRTKEERCEIW
ncbi:hypothetical protein OC846_001132 [Tilletia horrida]|uniref:Endothelin-converting enzyme 1 n=1 Tax=Tilletia horrida TaxID=155126 RepID=A0AAN6GVR5_9BASI|nr:hypothetical protein OC845_004530 [Tilletia horrida]KAK0556435.1 hypothetical protein OC846_001132 [Tilletia horrida]